MSITLIGMPGSGKSFVGQHLADRLGFELVLIDKIIEKKYDLPLQQVVEKLGSEDFLDTEADTVIEETKDRENLVISPGGSVVYRSRAMDHLKRISRVVYLKVPLPVLEARINGVPRGIVDAGHKSLAELYVEREPLYEKFADHIIKGDVSPEDIVADIVSAMSSYKE